MKAKTSNEKLPAIVRRAAREMLCELEANCLHVVKNPSRRGGYVRIVISHNAFWYRKFCAEYLSATGRSRRRRKRLRTYIKRNHTARALCEIGSGRASSMYAQRLLPIAEKWAIDDHRDRLKAHGIKKRNAG